MSATGYMHLADVAFGKYPAAVDLLDISDVPIKSEIAGVSDEAWTCFVKASITAPLQAVSPSNALGMFEIMPRRLADFGLVKQLKRGKSPKSGRTIWVADFMPPLTSDKFLKSPSVQYRVFAYSLRQYSEKIADGTITKPTDMSLSGALAILHRAGPKGLSTWAKSEKFPATQAAFERAEGIF